MGGNQHVMRDRNGGWNVIDECNSKSTAHTETKKEAIEIAREIAKNQQSELIIHRKDGTIQDMDSFRNDPNPPKVTKHSKKQSWI